MEEELSLAEARKRTLFHSSRDCKCRVGSRGRRLRRAPAGRKLGGGGGITVVSFVRACYATYGDIVMVVLVLYCVWRTLHQPDICVHGYKNRVWFLK